MAGVICLDFDDTILHNNLTRAIFEQFGGATVADLARAYHRGELSVEEYNAAALDTVTGDRDEIVRVACERAEPRAGLAELVGWAEWNGWRTVVLSSGFDLYIAPVIEELGLDRLPRHCGRVRFHYRWQVRYASPRGIEIRGRFKLAYLEAFRAAGDTIVYAGDGRSDVDPAREAEAVFARSTLWETLQHEHPRIHRFDDFHDVVGILDREAHTWLESSSSTTAAAGW